MTLSEVQRTSYASAGASLRDSWPEERSLDGPTLRAFLANHRYGILATSRPDGRPQAAPVAYVATDEALWFATVAGARLRNLRATPYASFVLAEGEGSAHRSVRAEGPATLHETLPVESLWLGRHASPPTWAAAYVELRPERLFSYAARREPPPDAQAALVRFAESIGRYLGRGTDGAGSEFTGELSVGRVAGGAALVLEYVAAGDEGDVDHAEHALLAPGADGCLTLHAVSTSRPRVCGLRLCDLDEGHGRFTFVGGDPELELTVELHGDGDVSLRYAAEDPALGSQVRLHPVWTGP